MGQILHGSATPTAAVRRAIQASQESLRVLAKRYGINRKAVAQGKHRTACRLARKIPNQRCSPLRTKRSSLLSVGVCCCRGMIAFTPCKHLSRSAVPRCLQRYCISRLPDVQGDRPDKKKFRSCPRGCFHTDLAAVQTAEGKLDLCVAIDRTSQFAFVQLVEKTGRASAAAFLEALIKAVPSKIHTGLTDNGIQFTFPPRYADGPTARYMTHRFGMCCKETGIEHRFTKVRPPGTNGQVERMNRTIKEATVKRYHHARHERLERHLNDVIDASHFGRR